MRVCHITSVHPRYDIRIFVKECVALTKVHNVTLIVADSLGDEIKDGVNILDIGKHSSGRIKRMIQSSRVMFEKVLQVNPDAVHFHDPELMDVGQKLAKLGYKVIYDVHEDVPKQVMNKHWIPKVLRPIISKAVEIRESIASRKFSGVVCATEIIANRFRGYNRNSIAIHNYPILAELAQREVNWNSRTNNLCYLGSISETRGILPLVDSLAISGLTLDLAGPYSNPDIELSIKHSSGAKHVKYHGVLNRSSVSNLLASVKVGIVTLLPTPSYVESLPIKLLEYMLAGIPIVASNFPLWEEYIKKNHCGLMVDPSNTNAISDACQYLINNQAEAKAMGERGRQAVINNYTWEVESQKLIKFYQKLK